MMNPLLSAAWKGEEQGVQQAVNPEAALEVLTGGCTPLHKAALQGNSRAVALLLAVAPQAATLKTGLLQNLPVHWAAQYGHAEAVDLLLQAAPETLNAPDQHGNTPLHYAASAGRENVVAQLLAAGAAAAPGGGANRLLPLHVAADRGHAAVVQQLLNAAPGSIGSRDSWGETALFLALFSGHLDVACCMVRAAPAVEPTLTELGDAASRSRTLLSPVLSGRVAMALLLFADLADRLSLTQTQWQSVPAPCPDLTRALPAVLARSAAEAGWMVGRLAEGQRERLRTAALCLHRAAPLPAGVIATILARCLARA